MNEIITASIVTIITAIIASVISHFTSSCVDAIKKNMPKKKLKKLNLFLVIKYPIFLIPICCIYFLIPFGKLFVVSIFILFVIITYFVVRDFVKYCVCWIEVAFEQEKLEEEIKRLTRVLGKCDPNNKKAIYTITQRLDDARKKLDSL